MKSTSAIIVASLYVLMAASCTPVGCPKLTKDDSIRIGQWYASTHNKDNGEEISLPKVTEFRAHGLADPLNGVPITPERARQEIDSFISGIARLPDEEQAVKVRSFAMDTRFLREYFRDNCYEAMPFLKVCLGYAGAYIDGGGMPQTTFVFLGYDANGSYIPNAAGMFYNQIAACPMVCPGNSTQDVYYEDFRMTAVASHTVNCTTVFAGVPITSVTATQDIGRNAASRPPARILPGLTPKP